MKRIVLKEEVKKKLNNVVIFPEPAAYVCITRMCKHFPYK